MSEYTVRYLIQKGSKPQSFIGAIRQTRIAQSMVQWFGYCILISIFSAYIGIHAVGPKGNYLDVFRFVGCAAFMGYSLAFIQDAIWGSKNWTAVLKSVFDGLVCALVTAGTFGWFWQ